MSSNFIKNILMLRSYVIQKMNSITLKFILFSVKLQIFVDYFPLSIVLFGYKPQILLRRKKEHLIQDAYQSRAQGELTGRGCVPLVLVSARTCSFSWGRDFESAYERSEYKPS